MSKLDDIQTTCDNCTYTPALSENCKEIIKDLILELVGEIDFKVKPHIQNAGVFNMLIDEKTKDLRQKVQNL